MKRLLAAAAALALLASPALAQSVFDAPGYQKVPGGVSMCLNSSGFAVPLYSAAGAWQCAAALSPATAANQLLQLPSTSATASYSHVTSAALVAAQVVKASAGNLYSANCTAIAGAAAGFCVAYNAATAPAAGALTGSLVLDYCFIDTTAKGCTLTHTPAGYPHTAGIVVLITSAVSPFTYTTGVLTGAISADFK